MTSSTAQPPTSHQTQDLDRCGPGVGANPAVAATHCDPFHRHSPSGESCPTWTPGSVDTGQS
jgi:hypothetical protein